MRSQLPSAPSLKSMGRRRDEGPPPALRGTSPSPSEGGEPPTGHSLIWLDKLFFLLSSPYLLKTLTLFIKVPHVIYSTIPRYLFNIPTLFIKVPHIIYSISPHYLFNIPTLSVQQSQLICSTSPPYLLKSLTLSIQYPHAICSTSPPYLLYSYTPSTFVIMSFCLQKNICLHLSLCYYVLKKTSVSICHYVIMS